MVIQAENYMGFTFGDMTITWHIADMTEYKKWRSARRWAGGSGHCDGLGNAYAAGPQCDTMGTGNADPNAPTNGDGSTTPGGSTGGGTTPGVFAVTAPVQVVAGDMLTISVANTSGQIKNCAQSLDAQLNSPLNFVVSSDGATASATAPVVTADANLSITCISTDERSATPVSVKVLTAPALAVTVKEKKVLTTGKMRLVLQAKVNQAADYNKAARLFLVAATQAPISGERGYFIKKKETQTDTAGNTVTVWNWVPLTTNLFEMGDLDNYAVRSAVFTSAPFEVVALDGNEAFTADQLGAWKTEIWAAYQIKNSQSAWVVAPTAIKLYE